MAIQLYVALQTPTVELKVEAKDSAGTKSSMLVGFKRYETLEAEEKLEEYQEILKDISEENKVSSTKIETFIKDHIVYIKKVELETVDEATGKIGTLKVEDTRSAKPVEAFWGGSEECLSVLVDMFLHSTPWIVSLIGAMGKSLVNSDYAEGAAKNS